MADIQLKQKEPLSADQVNVEYGSRDEDQSQQHDQGGLINDMPTQGYCLVFLAQTDWYVLRIEKGTIKVERNPDFDDAKEYEAKLRRATGGKADNLLKNFKHANIKYRIIEDKARKYIYVIITASKDIVEEWADRHNVDIEIEPIEAVRIGRTFKEFLLAERTYIPDDRDKILSDDTILKSNQFMVGKDAEHAKKTFDKLPLADWDYIHVSYEDSLPQKVYKKDDHGNVLDNRTYLRLLYEMLTDDVKMGGANFLVEKYTPNKFNPLQCFFALHAPVTERPTIENWFACRSPSTNMAFVDELRDYYGENIGFYFAFLVHYTKWLYPMAIIGTIWMIVELAFSNSYGVATPGSTVFVLVSIMWAVFMIENWYRREWKLRFKWGMMNYEENEIPRPTFKGKITVSRENGEIIEDYKSWAGHILRRIFSLSSLLFCVSIVVGAVIGLIILKRDWSDSDVKALREGVTVYVGVINAIWIQITNRLYTWLALVLNEWEGHRLRQQFYDNLVIKRIIFIVFNSFYSVFNMAILDEKTYEYPSDAYADKEESDKQRLRDVQVTLVTLFGTAIVISNFMEIGLPWLFKKIKAFCAKKEEDEGNEAHNGGLLEDDHLGQVQENEVSKQLSRSNINVNEQVMDDIKKQVFLGPQPDVLANTAEIVVLHGYIILFAIVFPIMPLLCVMNNYIELRLDAYNLFESQRWVPASASGIGVWKSVISTFNILAVGTNFYIVTFRTPLMESLLEGIGIDMTENEGRNLWICFFIFVLFMLFVILVIRNGVNDMSYSVKEAIARQDACEKHLFMAPLQSKARAAHRASLLQEKNAGNKDEDEQKHEQ